MANSKIDSAIEGENKFIDYSVEAENLDSPRDSKETEWTNTKWMQQLGYFNQIAELNATINVKSTWTIGKGLNADETTQILLDSIKGSGIDTFNTILENMIRTYYIGGDAYAEIIRDNEGNLLNIKPLNPGRINIVTNRQGLIIRYEDRHKMQIAKFKPEQIFHLSRNRIGDQVHGVSVIDSVENIILARNESIADYKEVMHKFVKPQWKFRLKTDDAKEIAAYKAKQDAATAANNNIYEPFDVSESELLAVSPNSTLDPKAWINQQGNFFYEAVGVPRIILGGSGEFTEASAKIAYLAFQQNIEEEQLYIEEQILSQLQLVIELTFPVSLENEMLSDNKKDGSQTESKPSETTAGSGE